MSEHILASRIVNNERSVGDNGCQSSMLNRIDLVTAAADSHCTERPGVAGFNDAVDVLTFRHGISRGLLRISRHLIILMAGLPTVSNGPKSTKLSTCACC